ncbi:putative Cinnamoyl-CoA reductase [Zostera marina]|uniref:Putative Cinnamoyl-CoA reductase n=1 Tax=Zostera marina TaxID=29655 RepID=A0A0K9PZ15_ZOSMR|nr:putative Cinnamoyl-CoA reductase [Zostera marina]
MGSVKGLVCVTGAGGYIASWLVKRLLSDGYKVHGTVRDPHDEKNRHLKKLDKAVENLKLFKADLLDCDSLLSPIAGCEGVFHTACPVPRSKLSDPETEMVVPAVTGTLNLLKICSQVKVRRVVVVSSGGAVAMNPNWPSDKEKDETCWSDKEYCKSTGNWYFYAKTLAEEEALNYGKMNELDVVTVMPCMVIGPLLQSTLNSSSLWFINMLKGTQKTLVNKGMSLVDVRDVADALLLVYVKPEANGRYGCASNWLKMDDLANKLKNIYQNYKYPTSFTETTVTKGMSPKKLKALGWSCRDIDSTIADSVKCFEDAAHL